jgi:hypothetical protein
MAERKVQKMNAPRFDSTMIKTKTVGARPTAKGLRSLKMHRAKAL